MSNTDTLNAPDNGDQRVAVVAKLADAATPGYQAPFDPDEAEAAGAFQEDALTEGDALESAADLPEALAPEPDGPGAVEPAYLVDDAGLAVPAAPTVATAADLFGYRVGEKLTDALDRQRPH